MAKQIFDNVGVMRNGWKTLVLGNFFIWYFIFVANGDQGLISAHLRDYLLGVNKIGIEIIKRINNITWKNKKDQMKNKKLWKGMN